MTDVTHRRPALPDLTSAAPCEEDLVRLLERSAAGDETAFAELYDATSSRCFGLAMRILRDAAEAERVTCESYLQVWTHASRYNPVGSGPFAWIAAIVQGQAVAVLGSGATA